MLTASPSGSHSWLGPVGDAWISDFAGQGREDQQQAPVDNLQPTVTCKGLQEVKGLCELRLYAQQRMRCTQ